MKKLVLTTMMMATAAVTIQAQTSRDLPVLPPMPEVDAPGAIGSVPLGDVNTFREIQLDIPITEGPFQPSWESIEKNYPGTPSWLREAKFGIWVHFGPQAAGESGDWYARNLYKEGHYAYNNHTSLSFTFFAIFTLSPSHTLIWETSLHQPCLYQSSLPPSSSISLW